MWKNGERTPPVLLQFMDIVAGAKLEEGSAPTRPESKQGPAKPIKKPAAKATTTKKPATKAAAKRPAACMVEGQRPATAMNTWVHGHPPGMWEASMGTLH